ncbi:MAG: MoxR family ATPase, partial [Lachnospiraceae bacterium]|nr:MoxR family ATPase [Lachnospiraceae bacterium]
EDCIQNVMAAILAGGHVLLEDVPGVGKTEMALAFSRAMNLKQNRIQFTPDVLPADITGFSMYQKATGQFVYQPGAVMCNFLLADEINRTSPKTQAALLEVMEEGNVTVDGITRSVPDPFIVIATQNPVGSYGTQRLPESQMDRFMICTSMGYPDRKAEVQLLKDRHRKDPIEQVQTVIHEQDLLNIRADVEKVFIHDAVYDYIVRLAAATRNHPLIELGISPRGTLALCKMSKALAFLNEREYVLPQEVKQALPVVALHRLRLNAKARVSNQSSEDILEEIISSVVAPSPGKKTSKSL